MKPNTPSPIISTALPTDPKKNTAIANSPKQLLSTQDTSALSVKDDNSPVRKPIAQSVVPFIPPVSARNANNTQGNISILSFDLFLCSRYDHGQD